MTITLDVTDKVGFKEKWINEDDENPTMLIRCVCGKEFEYSENIYNKETRLLWDCPECEAKLYFEDTEDHRNKIVRVIEE
jgi:hypothetical protein